MPTDAAAIRMGQQTAFLGSIAELVAVLRWQAAGRQVLLSSGRARALMWEVTPRAMTRALAGAGDDESDKGEAEIWREMLRLGRVLERGESQRSWSDYQQQMVTPEWEVFMPNAFREQQKRVTALASIPRGPEQEPGSPAAAMEVQRLLAVLWATEPHAFARVSEHLFITLTGYGAYQLEWTIGNRYLEIEIGDDRPAQWLLLANEEEAEGETKSTGELAKIVVREIVAAAAG